MPDVARYYGMDKLLSLIHICRERSDIDIAVSGVDNFDKLAAMAEELPTLYSVDSVSYTHLACSGWFVRRLGCGCCSG